MLYALTLVLAGVVTLVGAVVFTPLLCVLGGGLSGWLLANWFSWAGVWVIQGANAVGLHITLLDLPFIGAALGFFGAFIRSTSTTNVSK